MSTASIRFALLAVVLGVSPAFSATDGARNATERATGRAELRADSRAVAEDREDRLEIEILLDDFRVAHKRGDAAALAALDARVESYLALEVEESTEETGATRRELRRDTREVRDDRAEIRRDRRTGADVAERGDDRRDLRDDRRDRRRDRRDAARESGHEERIAELRKEWLAIEDDASAAKSLARKEAVLEQLAALARSEVGTDLRERREDRRELREDRRETREDRREG